MSRSIVVSSVVAGVALLAAGCSDAPLITRAANRVVLAELFSTTG